MRAAVAVDALARRVGQEIGVSSWKRVTQAMIDRFAELTDDPQFIHVDPVRAAAETPYGGTIAHGFLTLSLLSAFSLEALPEVEGQARSLNYGFDRIRFLAPVPCGARLRGRFTLAELTRRAEREVMLRYAATVEIEGAEKPALAADWLTLKILA